MKKEGNWKNYSWADMSLTFSSLFTSHPLSYVLWRCNSFIYSSSQWDVRICNRCMSFAVFWPILREYIEGKGLFLKTFKSTDKLLMTPVL